MKRNKKCVILAVLLLAVAMFSLQIPTYAMPSVRDGIVTDKDGIIEGDTPEITLPKITTSNQDPVTPNVTDNSNDGGILSPDGVLGNDTVTTDKPSTSTQAPTTSAPVTSNTNQTTTMSAADEEGARFAVWGVVLAIVIAAAVIAIIYMTVPKKRK